MFFYEEFDRRNNFSRVSTQDNVIILLFFWSCFYIGSEESGHFEMAFGR